MPAEFSRTDCCLDDDEEVCALMDCYEDPWLDPGASGECAGYLVARLILLLCYAGIFFACARYMYNRWKKGGKSGAASQASNKDHVVASLCCGALVRVASFCGPMPLAAEEILRSLKDCCWTVSFALIVVFWVEMQKYVGAVAGVNRMRPTLFGTVALYVLMAVVRAAALSVCSAPSWLGSLSKYLVYFFNIVLFAFGVKYGSGVVSLASSKPRFARKGAGAVRRENRAEVEMSLAGGGGAGGRANSDDGAPSRVPACLLAVKAKLDTLLYSKEQHMKLVRFIFAEFLLIVILFIVLIARNSAKPDEGEDRSTYNGLKVTEKMLELAIFFVLCLTMTVDTKPPPASGAGGSSASSSAGRRTSRAPSSMSSSSSSSGAAAARPSAMASQPTAKTAPDADADFSRTNPLVEAAQAGAR